MQSKGLRVAIIDSLPFGGTCALRGCEPKKILIEAAKTIDANHRLENKSISDIDKVHLNWHDLINFKRTFTEPFPKQREDSYFKAGIVPIHGKAKFIDKDTIKVKYNKMDDTPDNEIIKGKYILIATGAGPVNLGIPGLENVITSDQFLDIESYRLPDNIAFIGGGYISFEFAHIAARSGVKNITIFHRGKQALAHFDPDLVNLLVHKSKNIGIDVRLETKVEKIDILASSSSGEDHGKLVVYYSSAINSPADDKLTKTLEADMVVHGAGRVPNIEELDLKAGDIEHTSSGIKVNQYLQSVSNPMVYAAGDVAASGGAPLTPVAQL